MSPPRGWSSIRDTAYAAILAEKLRGGRDGLNLKFIQ
jgi:hypothetical protein